MANIRQKLEFILDTKGADKVLNELKAVELGFKKTGEATKALTGKKRMSGFNDQSRKDLKQMAESSKKAAFWTKEFRMEFLGIMFAGMQLQRTFGNMFKDLIKNFRDLSDETNPLNKSMTNLEANFKFLKFQIIEAMGPMLTRLTDGLSNIVEALARSDPDKLAAIGISIAAIAAAGRAMFAVGQAGIAANAFMQFFANVKSGAYGNKLQNIDNKLGGIENKLAKGFAIGFAFQDASNAISEFDAGDYFTAIASSLESTGLFAAATGNMTSKGVKAVGAAIITFNLAGAVNKEQGLIEALSESLRTLGIIQLARGAAGGWALLVSSVILDLGAFKIKDQKAIDQLNKQVGAQVGGRKIGQGDSVFEAMWKEGKNALSIFLPVLRESDEETTRAKGAYSSLSGTLGQVNNQFGSKLPESVGKTNTSMKNSREEVTLLKDDLASIPTSITTTHTIIRKVVTRGGDDDDDDRSRAAVQSRTGSRGVQAA